MMTSEPNEIKTDETNSTENQIDNAIKTVDKVTTKPAVRKPVVRTANAVKPAVTRTRKPLIKSDTVAAKPTVTRTRKPAVAKPVDANSKEVETTPNLDVIIIEELTENATIKIKNKNLKQLKKMSDKIKEKEKKAKEKAKEKAKKAAKNKKEKAKKEKAKKKLKEKKAKKKAADKKKKSKSKK